MKLRRIVSMMAALMLAVSMFACAGAETGILSSYTIENAYVVMNEVDGRLVIEDKTTHIYTLAAADGTPVTTEPYVYMNNYEDMYKVAVESGLNIFGMIDNNGKLMVPMQYGDIVHISDRWQMGVILENATAENYDYKTFDGKSFYLISAYDVYYMGEKVGELSRTGYNHAYGRGDYLYVRDAEGNYFYYDKTFAQSAYESKFPSSSEYDETKDGIFHRGSGQKAFVPECTLTSDAVDKDLYEVEGRMLDLQGNVVFAPDAKYYTIYDFKGDYAKVRTESGKYGLIDRTGREVIPCEFDAINDGNTFFEGDYQIVIKDGKVGYVNKNGEITCEPKYSEDIVKSVYKMPMTYLNDLDGSVIILSAAVGELPTRYANVDISSYNGCPLAIVETADKKAGVIDLYGDTVIEMDGTYDSYTDLQVSADGKVIVGYNQDRVYVVYLLGGEEAAVEEAKAETEIKPEATEQPAPVTDSSVQNGVGGSLLDMLNGKKEADGLKCAKCGFVPEDGTAPKFCSECGNAF